MRRDPQGSCQAFSLVEVTIAIGIFAFVMVGILGLFPTALNQRNKAAVETRSAMIAEQLFASVRTSLQPGTVITNPALTNIILRDGPALVSDNSRNVNLLDQTKPIIVGYQATTSMPYYLFEQSGAKAWTDGIDETTTWEPGRTYPPTANEITTLAKLWATNVAPNLYRVDVEVRSPAIAPLSSTQPSVFSTLVYAP
jgi:type II secretory pathway pseudopilin PulG